jgi:hypothetical protein
VKSETITQTFNGLVEWRLEGNYFKLLTAAADVRVELYLGGRLVLLAPSVPGGFYQRVAFDHVKITTSSLHEVEFITAPDEGGVDRVVGTFDIDNLYAEALTNEASAVVGVAAASVLAAAAGRKWLRFRSRSTNTDDICLGAAGVTMNGPLRISPGEVVDVTTAAPAQWFGIAGAAAQNLDILSGA